MKKFTFILAIVFFSSLTNANEKTYENCSLEWSEGFKYLDYYVSEVPINKAKKLTKTPERVTELYKLSMVYGAVLSYFSVHIEYKKCVLPLKDNVQLTKTESKYKNCSFQSNIRTKILESIIEGKSEEKVKARVRSQHKDLAISLYSKAKDDSVVKALNFSGNLLVECVENILSE